MARRPRVALITGGAAGIGRATALAFAREGARVAFIDCDGQQGPETAQRIEAACARALFIKADVTDAEQVASAWLCCRHGIPEIIRSGGGSVINMSSIFAFLGAHGTDTYTAAKGAASALTRSMAVEFAKDRVR